MKHLDKPNWRKQSERKKYLRWILFGVILMLPLVVGAAFVYKNAASGNTAVFTSELEFSGSRILVKAGGDFQSALNRAKSGDTIVLQAGAEFTGAFVLPKKAGDEYITIQSSEAAKLPKDGERVGPKGAVLMPKILSSGKGESAIKTASGAHHYRFVGVEVAPANNDYIYNLIYLGDEEGKNAGMPHHIEIDRSYIHSNLPGITRRGIALNNADTSIKNSYLAGFAGAGEETQGICGWTGTERVKIINNYIEGGAENIMFGGSDPASADLNPADIEIRGNHLNKPAEWKDKKFTMKCLFELKNAVRVSFTGNYLENNWVGSAFRITVRNDGGKAPFSTIEDVSIKDNIVRNAGEGINILGSDDLFPSQTLKRLTISNNLLLEIENYFIQISGGEDVSIVNNTSFNGGNIASIYGAPTVNLVFRDNIVGHGNYGIHGFEKDIVKSNEAQRIFQNNVFINNRNVPNSEIQFPPNNFWVTDANAVGFQKSAPDDFRLAPQSRFKDKGRDGTNIGSDLPPNSSAK